MGLLIFFSSFVIPAGLATALQMVASLNAFPLESSAMCNKKAVLWTVSFVISEHCFVQARQCSEKQKPLFRVAFLLRIALVIPAGFEPTTHSLEGCCSIQLSYETITYNISYDINAVQKYIKYIDLQNFCIYYT